MIKCKFISIYKLIFGLRWLVSVVIKWVGWFWGVVLGQGLGYGVDGDQRGFFCCCWDFQFGMYFRFEMFDIFQSMLFVYLFV